MNLSKDQLAKIRKNTPKITPKQLDNILDKGKPVHAGLAGSCM